MEELGSSWSTRSPCPWVITSDDRLPEPPDVRPGLAPHGYLMPVFGRRTRCRSMKKLSDRRWLHPPSSHEEVVERVPAEGELAHDGSRGAGRTGSGLSCRRERYLDSAPTFGRWTSCVVEDDTREGEWPACDSPRRRGAVRRRRDHGDRGAVLRRAVPRREAEGAAIGRRVTRIKASSRFRALGKPRISSETRSPRNRASVR
jgi:hypothetical protein